MFLQQNRYQGKTKGKHSGYAAAASAIAPEFSAMNARLKSKSNEEANQTNKPASMHDEHESPISEASPVSIKEESVHTGYVNFEEVMAQSKKQPKGEQEQSNQQSANGTSRGWFIEEQSQQQQPLSNRGNGKTKKSKKKKPRNGYSELASAVAPQLATVKVKEPKKKTSDAVACETDDTDISEPTSMTYQSAAVSAPNQSPEISGGSWNSPADFNQQQMINNGQQKDFKRPRRPKKHGKKKGCYAQAAIDIAPLYHAMNDRLKEQQLLQKNSQQNVSLNDDSGEEDLTTGDSPSFESEPFVFVNSSDGEPSLSPISMETEQTEVVVSSYTVSLSDDVVEDSGPTSHRSQPSEQQVDSESSGDDKEKRENSATEQQKDINVVVKEVPHNVSYH